MTFDDLRSVDRKQLDSRRVGAVLIDILLLTPIELVAMQYDRGAVVLATALGLVYFHLCDVLTGQTLGKSLLGLRTVTVDGELVSGKAAASRTVLRVIDHTLLGLIVMVATGGKRQRIGDLVARTVVVRAADVMPAPRALSPSQLLYPVVWLVPAVVVFFLSAEGHLAGSYRANANAVCADANALMRQAQSPVDVGTILARQADELEALHVPANWQPRHEALVAETETLTLEIAGLVRRARTAKRPERVMVRGWERISAQIPAANARIAALGFEDCAASS